MRCVRSHRVPTAVQLPQVQQGRHVGRPAAAARPLLSGNLTAEPAGDTSFAALHGLYWLVANLAANRPLLIAVDDAHWADKPSLRWLAYLAPRLDGLAAGMLVRYRLRFDTLGRLP